MLEINLLPQSEQDAVRRELRLRAVLAASSALVLSFLVGVAFLLPTYLPLAYELRGRERLLEAEEERSRSLGVTALKREAESFAKRLDEAKAFLAPRPLASDLAAVFLSSPAGIRVDSFSLSENGAVSLSGRASTRGGLLEFERSLRESGRFQELAFPLSNIVRETDIRFTLQGILKSAYRP